MLGRCTTNKPLMLNNSSCNNSVTTIGGGNSYVASNNSTTYSNNAQLNVVAPFLVGGGAYVQDWQTMAAPTATGLETMQQQHLSHHVVHHLNQPQQQQQQPETLNLQQQQHQLQYQHPIYHHSAAAAASCSNSTTTQLPAVSPMLPHSQPHSHQLQQHSQHQGECCNCYLPVLQPDVLLNNDRGLFKVYCFIKDFIG